MAKNKDQFPLSFSLHNLRISMYEWAASIVDTNEQWKEFEKLDYLIGWHIDALEKGDTDFSWQKIHDRGWFSLHTYQLFKKELKEAGVDVTKGKYGVDIIKGKYCHKPNQFVNKKKIITRSMDNKKIPG